MLDRQELLSIIPHKGKMFLLDRINNYNPQECTIEAEYKITQDCIFYDSEISGVPAWVGFEFIAQSIAAFAGIRDMQILREKGQPPKIGFILSVSALTIEIPFYKEGSILTIKTKEIQNMAPVYNFYGEILLDGKIVLCGKLTVMEADNDQINKINNKEEIN